MALLKDIVFWSAVAVFYLAFGYQYAKLSCKVYEKWKDVNSSVFCGASIRLFIFPGSSMYTLEDASFELHRHGAVSMKSVWVFCVILSMFFWPLRIIYPFIVLLMAVSVGMLTSTVWIICNAIKDLFLSFRSALKSSTNS